MRRPTIKPKARKTRTVPVTTDHSAAQFDRLKSERDEALEQLAATTEILRVIRASPIDVQPVFETIVRNAVSLCGSLYSNVFRFDGELLHFVATRNMGPGDLKLMRKKYPMRPDYSQISGRVVLTKSVIQVEDALTDPDYDQRYAQGMGLRKILGVPMLRDGHPIGVIVVGWAEAGRVPKAQEDLLKTFADQAAIAIENTRLLNELRQRTGDLSEALEQQTATSEVLRMVSASPGEFGPVFKVMLENATRICGASYGMMFLREGTGFRTVAMHNLPHALAEERRRVELIEPIPDDPLCRLAATKQKVHIPDARTETVYKSGFAPFVALVEDGGARTLLVMPLLREDELIGAFAIYRQEVRPFTDKQIELVKNFAIQAVIAFENARLLDDLDKLNQQLEQRVTDQVSEIERMSKLRRFLPPQVADLIVTSGTEKQLESHRREITALFCDLRGFTGFSESSDPEDVMALLREYHAAIGEIINTYGGTLERYAGDGVMVVFNDPIPVDNPALQAVLMAVDMRAAIGDLIEKWRKLGHDIGFGIGIAHGFATLGTIGFEGRFDYAAIGTVSNVASRLCDEAKPGQILISPRVLMAVEDAISVEPVGEFKLKGISRPLATYNVLSAVSAKI